MITSLPRWRSSASASCAAATSSSGYVSWTTGSTAPAATASAIAAQARCDHGRPLGAGAGAERDADEGDALAGQLVEIDLGAATAEAADLHDASADGRRRDVVGERRRADVVDDHVDAATVGQLGGDRHQVLGRDGGEALVGDEVGELAALVRPIATCR